MLISTKYYSQKCQEVDVLAKETIDAIRKAEMDSENAIRQAKAQADAIRKQAEEQAEKLADDAFNSAEAGMGN